MGKKKFVVIIIVLLIVAGAFVVTEFYLGDNGKTDNVRIGQIDSSKFSSDEIDAAMNCVIDKFKADFSGCELTDLWYDEEFSNTRIAESYDIDNTIVILSNFNVDSNGASLGLNPDSTYTDWMWILTRDSEKDQWTAKDWGY